MRAASTAGHTRRGVFAAHPGEPVWSVNLASTLMPLASAATLQTYRFALALALAVPFVAALFGFLPFAFAAAAVAVPFVFLLYLRDVNQWEDEPIPVVLGAVVLAGLLAAGFTLLWRNSFIHGALAFVPTGKSTSIDLHVLLMVAVVVPVVSELLKELGPCILASRKRFDDMIDGLTFGVVAGASYAAVETLVINASVVFSGPERIHHPNGAVWVSIIVVSGLLKPVIYGAASGLAVAAWSGAGKGYNGLGRPYARGLAEAILANVLFQGGLYMSGRIGGTVGVTLGVAWALLLAAALVLRLRFVLHGALLEEALEATNNKELGIAAAQGEAFCANCELPLLDGASFCVSCGMAVRAASKLTRQANSEKTRGARAGTKSFPAPALARWGSASTPAQSTRHSTQTILITALALVALIGGAFAAVNSATRPSKTGSKIVTNGSAGESSSHSSNLIFGEQRPPKGKNGGNNGNDNGNGGNDNGNGGNDNGNGGSDSGDSGCSLLNETKKITGVKLHNDVMMTVPDNWDIGDCGTVVDSDKNQVGNWVLIGANGALIEVDSFDVGDSAAAADIAQGFMQSTVSQQFQDIQLGNAGAVQGDGSLDVYDVPFSATSATNQGSVSVEGTTRAIVVNGAAVVFEQVNGSGQYDNFKDDFATIYTSVFQSLPS